MSTQARRRLIRDLKKIQNDAEDGVTAAPCEDDLLKWDAFIFGPADTPWEGATFQLSVQFTEEFPVKPPDVRFLTEVYHPNVYANGSICLDILRDKWTPVYDVMCILRSIQSLLTDPNPGSAANTEACELYTKNREAYNRRVRQCVEKSWQLTGRLAGAPSPLK